MTEKYIGESWELGHSVLHELVCIRYTVEPTAVEVAVYPVFTD